MCLLLYVSADFHLILDVWGFVVRSQDKRSNKKENLHLMSIWPFGKILELFLPQMPHWRSGTNRPKNVWTASQIIITPFTCFPRKSADTDPVKVQNLLLSRRKEMDKGRDEDWGGPRPGGAVPRRWKPQWTPNLLRPTNLFPARLEFRRPRTFFRYKRWIRNLQNPQENVCRSDLFYCKGDCRQILSKPGTIISH